MIQFFRTDDEKEQKVYSVGVAPIDVAGLALDQFFQDAFSCRKLGELLYDSKRVPLANAIKREIFLQFFTELFEVFAFSGTFESYLTVLRKIFGEDAEIEFIAQGDSGLVEYGWIDSDGDNLVDSDGDHIVFGEPQAPGMLTISVKTSALSLFGAAIKEIENGTFVNHTLVDSDGDRIVYSGLQGIETASELKSVVLVLAPAGIPTNVILQILS